MPKKFYIASTISLFILLMVVCYFFIVTHSYQKTLLNKFTAQDINAQNGYKGNPNALTYREVIPFSANIKVLADNIDQVSDLQITPDGQYLLAATLPGKVEIFKKKNGAFVRQKDPFFKVPTSKVTMPEFQIGLTGLAFGADFATSGDVFLFYSEDGGGKAKAISQSDNPNQSAFKNKIIRVTFSSGSDEAVGKNPVTIFEGNALASQAHQIEKGVGVMIAGVPSLLFTIGDSFNPQNAMDPKVEAGKLMLIQRDGKAVPGKRPFVENPKVQGISMRNGTSLAYDKGAGKLLLTDTSNDNFDRLLYGTFFDASGNNDRKLSFKWNGNDESLLSPVPDLYTGIRDTVLYRWSPSETPVNVAFYDNPSLPALPSDARYILVTTFGETLSPLNKPGKRISLGILRGNSDKPIVALRGLIERTYDGKNKLGNPIGLAVDPQTKEIYFGDIMEGKIYKAAVTHQETRF